MFDGPEYGKHREDDLDKDTEEIVVHTRTGWQELIAEVPRDPFIPDTIWVDVDTGGSCQVK